MVKNLKLLMAAAALVIGYAGSAQALFDNCSADVGKKGGPNAYKCVDSTSAAKDSNFLAAFIMNHCARIQNGKLITQPRTSKDRDYCEEAIAKFASANQINSNKMAAREINQYNKIQRNTQQALQKSNKTLMKASSKMTPPPSYDDSQDMEQQEDDENYGDTDY